MTDTSGDVVCVGLVERGQVIDWLPGGREPDSAEWIAEAAFADILQASAKAGVPVLPKLDLYTQTRLGSAECTRILARWSGLETALKGTRAEAPTLAMRRLLQVCANGSRDVELLIEGP